MMKKPVIILVILLVFTWFILGEKKTFWEKAGVLLFVILFYIGFRLISGATLDEIFAPFRDLSGSF